MTADDVRARFEAWHDEKWPEPKSGEPYHWRVARADAKTKRWEVWQAAHADMAGEVRDAARWRAFISALRTRLPGPAHGTRIKVIEVCPMYGDEKEVGDIAAVIDAALAKFHPTHQEKP